MAFVDAFSSGSGHMYLIGSNASLLMGVIPTYCKSVVVYHRVLYLALYCFFSTLMIYLMSLRNSIITFFADDTNIYCESSDLSDLINIVNRELKSVKHGLMLINISLNIEKTNYNICHSSSVNIHSDAVNRENILKGSSFSNS